MMKLSARKERAKRYIFKRGIKFEDCINCLENNKTILRSRQSFRGELHKAFAEKSNKISLSANDDKRIQTPNGVISCPYGTSSKQPGALAYTKNPRTK